MNCAKSFLRMFSTCHKAPSLIGRKYVTPSDLSPEEILSVLNAATDLKCGNDEYLTRNCLKGRTIILLLNQPCVRLQSYVHTAAKLLQMSLCTIVHPNWDTSQIPSDMGKLLSITSDIIFCQSPSQIRLEEFAKNSSVPVVNVGTCRFVMLHILSDLLTLQQHFGRLDGLTLSWVGHSCPFINTYLTIIPALGMKVKFLCDREGPVSPLKLNSVEPEHRKTTVKECRCLSDVLQGANVIATNKHGIGHLKITMEVIKQFADQDWVFLYCLPSSSNEVDDEVFTSDRNLLWASFCNFKYICAALIKKFLVL